MSIGKQQSWRVAGDIPEKLQFASFVAEQSGFSLDPPGPEQGTPDAEWASWWASLIEQAPALPTDTFTGYDPPEFYSLVTRPRLRDLCRSRWPSFKIEWGHDKPRLARSLTQQLDRLAIADLVQECARGAGRQPGRFDLNLAFVPWPSDYRHVSGDSYVIMGSGFLAEPRLSELREIVRGQLRKLV